MLRLTRTAIGLLTAQYRSVLKKCWAINVGIFALSSIAAMIPTEAEGALCYTGNGSQVTYYDDRYTCPAGSYTLMNGTLDYSGNRIFLTGKDSNSNENGFWYRDSDTGVDVIKLWDGAVANGGALLLASRDALYDTYIKPHNLSMNYNGNTKVSISADSSGGYFQVNDDSNIASVSIHGSGHSISLKDTTGNGRISLDGGAARIVMDNTSDYNTIEMYGQDRKLQINNASGAEKTVLSDASFKLNGSSISATGIVASATQNSTALITSGGVYSALNNYYTKV